MGEATRVDVDVEAKAEDRAAREGADLLGRRELASVLEKRPAVDERLATETASDRSHGERVGSWRTMIGRCRRVQGQREGIYRPRRMVSGCWIRG